MQEPPVFPTPAPLCKVHYHIVYNELQPTQTYCVTCGSDLRKSTVRVCPDPERIQKYLADKTGYDGEIVSGAVKDRDEEFARIAEIVALESLIRMSS